MVVSLRVVSWRVVESAADDDLVGGGVFEDVDELVELRGGALVLLRDPGEPGLLGVGDELAGLVALAAVLGQEVAGGDEEPAV
jgi:hypothetical protein